MDDTALSHWLRLREPVDHRSRVTALTEAIAVRVPAGRTWSIVDLGTGAGSNFRYLAERLGGPQRWLLVDRSEQLLTALAARTKAWASTHAHRMKADDWQAFSMAGPRLDCQVELRAQDLNTLDDGGLFAGRTLVTASALLDLVSESWLRMLASQCRRVGAHALFTLTYDGRSACIPAEPEDDLVRAAMNRHQRRDKGLGGPAEGPTAAACAERCFVEEGYRVAAERSDWMLGPEDESLQRVLIEGWAEVAREVLPHHEETIRSWYARRLAHLDAGRSRLVVGHRDVAAWLEPPGMGMASDHARDRSTGAQDG